MYKYRVPATSANVGIGFDALGLALNIYNYYTIEENDKFIYSGFLDDNDQNNLFFKAYEYTSEYFNSIVKPLKVKLKNNTPIARGLGSSSSMIVAGIFAYYLINKKEIDKKEILKIAVELEGHPDNVAPCIYGGLCAMNSDKMINVKISKKWYLSLLIPNYEVKTSEARKVIKQEISLKDCINNISSALIGVDALENFNIENITVLNNDKLHEPYRKELIKDYNICKETAFKKGAKAFLISGSGSSMLIISDSDIEINIENIKFKKVKVDYKGVTCQKSF